MHCSSSAIDTILTNHPNLGSASLTLPGDPDCVTLTVKADYHTVKLCGYMGRSLSPCHLRNPLSGETLLFPFPTLCSLF